jgi:hypothetical protein
MSNCTQLDGGALLGLAERTHDFSLSVPRNVLVARALT